MRQSQNVWKGSVKRIAWRSLALSHTLSIESMWNTIDRGSLPRRRPHHRITLWLDCNSEFYGSYEDTEAQVRGYVVQPTLD